MLWKWFLSGLGIFALGSLLLYVFEIEIFGVSLGTMFCYTTPLCIFHGFKGCGKKSFKSEVVVLYTFILIFVALFFMPEIEPYFPMGPVVAAFVIGMLSNGIITKISHGDNVASRAVNRMSEHQWTMIQLGVAAFIVPATGIAIKLYHHVRGAA